MRLRNCAAADASAAAARAAAAPTPAVFTHFRHPAALDGGFVRNAGWQSQAGRLLIGRDGVGEPAGPGARQGTASQRQPFAGAGAPRVEETPDDERPGGRAPAGIELEQLTDKVVRATIGASWPIASERRGLKNRGEGAHHQ